MTPPCATAWVHGIFDCGFFAVPRSRVVVYPTPLFLQCLSGIQRRKVRNMKPFLSILYALLLLPILFFIISGAFWLFALLIFPCAEKFFGYIVTLRVVWGILWFLTIGGFFIAIFQFLFEILKAGSMLALGILNKLTTYSQYAMFSSLSIIALNALWVLYETWTIIPTKYSGWIITECITISFFILDFAFTLTMAVLTVYDKQNPSTSNSYYSS